MIQSWIMHCPLSVCKTHSDHRVFPTPSKIPYGGFSPVRLQTGSRCQPSPHELAYMAPKSVRRSLWRSRACKAGNAGGRSRPEALGSTVGYVVRQGPGLLWPHPSHLVPSRGLFASSAENDKTEWVPNLSSVSVRACHPQYPGGPIGWRLLRPRSHWSSLYLQKLDIRNPRTLVPTWLRNEADSGSLALRPARLLALHQQGRLLPSFR